MTTTTHTTTHETRYLIREDHNGVMFSQSGPFAPEATRAHVEEIKADLDRLHPTTPGFDRYVVEQVTTTTVVERRVDRPTFVGESRLGG